MRILIAGASGALGRELVPILDAAGHDVIGTTRSASKQAELAALGAHPLILDALDRDAVMRAVTEAKPDVVVHQLTAIAPDADFTKVDKSLAATNVLRTTGLDYLLEAAVAAGARRFVAQSFTGWTNPRTGSLVKTEQDPLDDRPPASAQHTLAAIRHVEEATTGAPGIAGVALRYGMFYGTGNAISPEGSAGQMVLKRRLPIVGNGQGVWSFIHITDAAQATALAIQSDVTGLYNIVDDEPAPVATWLPYLAGVLGAKPPMHVPTWLGRAVGGAGAVNAMTANRGSSNAKAKRDLGWTLRYPSWRDGFATFAR
ncbi:MAG TPA: NAD(P)-dependent oxidoreductase [Micromonosporaceae bacterium]|jgi:nucleoside-diphosphate-sugar epimerase